MLAWIVTSSVLIIAMIVIRKIFLGKISLKLQYGLWILVLVRLLCPVMIGNSSFSVLNLIEESELTDEARKELGSFSFETEESGSTDAWKGSKEGSLSGQTQFQTNNEAQNGQFLSGNFRNGTVGTAEESMDTESGEPTGKVKIVLLIVWIMGMVIAAGVLIGTNLHFARRLRRAAKTCKEKT